MPRQSQIKEHTRRQVDDKETFDFTTPNLKVAARPVDAYARPGEVPRVPGDPDVAAFVASMDNLRHAMTGGAKVWKGIEKDRENRGKADAAAKKAPQEDSDAYIMGHELISGKAAAADMESTMAQYFENAKDEDPVKFKAGLDNVSRQFMAGRSEAFVEGLMADAIGIEQKYTVAYQAHQTKKMKELGTANLTKAFDFDVSEIIAASDKIPIEQQAQAIRELITGSQEAGKFTYKLDRTETSSALLDVLRRKALDTANPDLLLRVATLEDAHGVRLIDNEKLAKEIDHGVQAAHAEREKVRNEFDKRVEKARNRIENAVSNKIFELLLNGDGNTKEAQELIYKYSDPTRNDEGVMLNPSMVSTAWKLITKRGEGYAESTNNALYVPLMEKAVREGLTTQEVLNAKRFCDEGDYKSLLSAHLREVDQKSKKPTRSQTRKDFDSVLSNLVTEVKVVGIGGKILDANGPTRARFVNNHMREWWFEYQNNNDGKEPGYSEWKKEMDYVKEQAFRMEAVKPLEDVTPEELQTAIQGVMPVAPPTRMTTQPPKPAAAPTKGGPKQASNLNVRSRLQNLQQERLNK